MKFLHVMKNEKFTKGISSFYGHHFANGEHEILYVNTPGKETLISPALNIRQEEIYQTGADYKQLNAIYRYMKKYDYVVMHSMFLAHPLILLYPKLIKKMIWIAWGYDLHNWPPKGSGIKHKIHVSVGNYLRNRCAGFVGIFPPDCDYFKERFPAARAKVFYAPYAGPTVPPEYQNYTPEANLEHDHTPICIQIGHSATKSVNHLQVLEDLAHLKDNDIQLLLPLSYGDMDYGNEVQQRAEEIFGDKALCLREFMGKDAYFSLLRRVDIAVFNTQRQIGLSNVNSHAFRNVKLYMPQTCPMYQYYKDCGVPVQDYTDLKDIDFETLKKPVKTTDPERFEEYINSLQNMNKKVGYWETVYSAMKEVR